MNDTNNKSQIVAQYRTHETDTGSAEVQIALITNRVNCLNKHFGSFPKDRASRTGLMKLVSRRRKYLDFLKSKDEARYSQLIARLGIRK
jgi:small subunit ribosomal protein S15